MNNKNNNKICYDAEELEAIIAALPEHIYWEDVNCVIQGCNDRQAQSAGFLSRYDLVGKTDHDMPWASKADDIIETNKLVMRSRKTITVEEETIVDGKTRVYLSTKQPRYDAKGNVIGLLGISVDITEKKKIEKNLHAAKKKAEEASKVKSDFIENMQHDLRTPAHGILSGLTTIINSDSTNVDKNVLALINESARELYKLCLEVTDYDKVKRHEKDVLSKKISLKNLISHVINLNKSAAHSKGIKLEVVIEPGIPDVVKSDDYRLKRILVNLIGNAIKFTHAGKVKLSVKSLSGTKSESVIRFEISDTGIGIPEDKVEFIYEEFSRCTPSNQGNYRGIGLGLRLVKRFVEDLNGDIEVSSSDQGTTFYITLLFKLPLSNDICDSRNNDNDEMLLSYVDNASENINANAKVAAKKIKSDNMAGNVLVVEDNLLAMMAAKKTLEGLGYHVETADSVKNAKSAIKKDKFTLILLDIGLPDGSGFDVADYIKCDLSHANHNTPFIALTAHSGNEKERDAKESGFLGLLTKPLDPKKLNAFLSQKDSSKTHINEEIIDLSFDENQLSIKLLKMLCDELPNDVSLIKSAVDNADIEKLKSALHKLKGALSYVQVPRLHEVINKLYDMSGNQNNLPKIEKMLNNLFICVDEVLNEFEKLKPHD